MSDPYKEEKTPLLIEFTKTTGQGGLERVSRPPPALSREELVQISNVAIDKAMTVIQDTTQRVKNSVIKSLGDDRQPDHVEVDFGVRCDTEKGVMISKALDEATFNVKLVWDNLGK